MIKLFPLLFVLLFTMSCDQVDSFFQSTPADPFTKKTFFKNGNLRSVKKLDSDKKKHGVSKQYFPSGKLKVEIEYVHGDKIRADQYYENGKLQMRLHYKDGMKHGLRSKYWKSGQLSSELMYSMNNPGPGLVEYHKSGKKVTKYPRLLVKQIDNLQSKGEYRIEVYFSSYASRGTYYSEKLEDGFLSEYAEKMKKINGKGVINFHPVPGSFLMKKVTFVGSYKTLYGNPYIVEKTVNMAIDY